MSATLYTYITSPYHSVSFPRGNSEPPDWEHFRTLSALLSLNPNQLRSPIGPEILPFIHGNHQFSARIYPDTPINFNVVIDINPLNYSPTPFFDFAKSVKTQIPTYYLRWDILPCAIPHFLYNTIVQQSYLQDIVPEAVLKEFEMWYAHLLITQNNLALHLHEPRAPQIPNIVLSPFIHPANPTPPTPSPPTDPLLSTQQ